MEIEEDKGNCPHAVMVSFLIRDERALKKRKRKELFMQIMKSAQKKRFSQSKEH